MNMKKFKIELDETDFEMIFELSDERVFIID
jgi:hypothetical protein